MSIIENQIRALSPQLYLQSQPFKNPICQQTYKALPKIYGHPHTTKAKYKNRIKFNSFGKPRCITYENEQAIHQYQLQNKFKKSKQIIKSYGTLRYSPSNHMQYKQNDSSYDEGRTSRVTKGKIKKLKLPFLNGLKSFQPKQIETKHKIIRTDSNQKATSIAFLTTGLGQLVSQNVSFSTNDIHKRINELQQLQTNKQKSIQNLINKHNSKNNSSSKLSHLEKKSENSLPNYQSPANKNNSIINKKNRQSVLKKNQNYRQNTVFQENNKKMELFENRKRGNSTNSNDLFVIPQENQYESFLENYQPMDSSFDFKSIMQQQNFRIVKSSKGVYFGEVQQGIRHGQGLYVSERQIYEGKFKNNVKFQGFERNIDGIYIGEFMDGQRSGLGMFKWHNGQVFQGQWKKGLKNGRGIWTSPKGDYYEGQWFMNRQQGKGIFKHKRSTYKGSFLNFLKHGNGEQKFANGDLYFGEYKQGRPDGKGRYQWSNGGYYQGEFSKGFRQGYGKWVQKNGNIYEGNFYQDCKHGQGQQTFKTGQTFIGQFDRGDQKSGILYAKNGSILKKIQ